MYKKGFLNLSILFYLLTIAYVRDLYAIYFIFMITLMISNLIEDKTLQRKVVRIFAIPFLLAILFMIIGFYNHGSDFDMTFENIF